MGCFLALQFLLVLLRRRFLLLFLLGVMLLSSLKTRQGVSMEHYRGQ